MRRTVQYGLSNYPELDKEKQYIRFLAHLKEKYAEGGYLRLWIPQSANAVHLQELRQLIADEEELHKVFEKIYSQETETIQNLENIPIFVRNKKITVYEKAGSIHFYVSDCHYYLCAVRSGNR